LTLLLVPATVLYMPVVVPLVAPEASVSPAAIAVPLLFG
jgi:BASS family bile acid:Na+ symporter